MTLCQHLNMHYSPTVPSIFCLQTRYCDSSDIKGSVIVIIILHCTSRKYWYSEQNNSQFCITSRGWLCHECGKRDPNGIAWVVKISHLYNNWQQNTVNEGKLSLDIQLPISVLSQKWEHSQSFWIYTCNWNRSGFCNISCKTVAIIDWNYRVLLSIQALLGPRNIHWKLIYYTHIMAIQNGLI